MAVGEVVVAVGAQVVAVRTEVVVDDVEDEKRCMKNSFDCARSGFDVIFNEPLSGVIVARQRVFFVGFLARSAEGVFLRPTNQEVASSSLAGRTKSTTYVDAFSRQNRL